MLGVSVRAWLATLVIGTLCALCVMGLTVPESLIYLTGAVTTYFFTGGNPAARPVTGGSKP